MKLTVTLHDADGNEIDPQKCKCGKLADHFIQGKECFQWICYECLYPNIQNAEFVYNPNLTTEWGGTASCFKSDGSIVNMEDELNRLEKDK